MKLAINFDQKQALAEGWGVFESDERGLEIQRFDEMGRFASDQEALQFVINESLKGEVNAIAALALTRTP